MTRFLKVGSLPEIHMGGTYGTVAATAWLPVRCKSISNPVDRGVMMEENIESWFPASGVGGALKVSGSLESNFRPIMMLPFLQAVLGSATTNIAATPTIDTAITFVLGSPTPISLQMGEKSTNASGIATQYQGVGIKSFALTMAAKDFAVCKIDWFSKIYKNLSYDACVAGISAASPAYDNTMWGYEKEEPVVFYNASITTPGGTSLKVKTMDITIDRKVDDDRFIVGDYTLQELGINGMTDIGGSMTMTEQEYNELLRTMYGDTVPTALNTANTVGMGPLSIVLTNRAAAEKNKMLIYIKTAIYTNVDTSITGQNEVEKKISWKAVGTDLTSDPAFYIMVWNTI